jgi:hypothetical protein
MNAKMDDLVDSVTATDRFPLLDVSVGEWMQIPAADLLPALAEVAGAGLTYYPPGVVVGETPVTDAAYAQVVPAGTQHYYQQIKSWRPETLPNWNLHCGAFTNPASDTPDVVMAWGWNAGAGGVEDAAKMAAWSAFESYYKPGAAYAVTESHTLIVQNPNNRWWAGSRRAISTEAFDVGGWGGYGVPVTIGCDTDVFALRSNCPDQSAYTGGEKRQVGADHFTVGHDVMTGTTSFRIYCRTQETQHGMLVQAHKDGHTLIQSDQTLYLRSSGNPLYIGAEARFEGPFRPASSSDTDAPNGSVYYSTTQNKLVFKDPDGTVNPLY